MGAYPLKGRPEQRKMDENKKWKLTGTKEARERESQKEDIDDVLRRIEPERANRRRARAKRNGRIKSALDTVIFFAVVFACAMFIVTFVGQRTRVSGSSMYDTLEDGDNLIVEMVSYRFSDPQRFDVIVFEVSGLDHVYYIKRIIGLPGETVQISDGNIYIDGELLEEDYGYEAITDPGLASSPITLGDDEYFVLGDNRNDSSDSRFGVVGNVSRSQIVGRAWVRIWPLNKIGFVSDI